MQVGVQKSSTNPKVTTLDANAANVSIAERLRGLDDEPVDTSSWLAPLELTSEVDGQPAVVFNELYCGSQLGEMAGRWISSR